MYAFVVASVLILTTNLELIVMNSIFKKQIPGDLRGTMMGVMNSIVNIGQITFQVLSLFLTKYYGLKAPFYLLIVADTFMFLMGLVASIV